MAPPTQLLTCLELRVWALANRLRVSLIFRAQGSGLRAQGSGSLMIIHRYWFHRFNIDLRPLWRVCFGPLTTEIITYFKYRRIFCIMRHELCTLSCGFREKSPNPGSKKRPEAHLDSSPKPPDVVKGFRFALCTSHPSDELRIGAYHCRMSWMG